MRNASENLPEKVATKGRATRYSAAHLLAKVYLTRGSAINDPRGQQTTDMDSTLYYAEKVIDSGAFTLQDNFASLWDISNQGNSEVVFAVQFTTEPMFNGDGAINSIFSGCPGMKTNPACCVILPTAVHTAAT